MCKTCGCEEATHTHTRRISLETDLLSKNDRIAHALRARLEHDGIVAFNLIGAPGAGKTTLLEHTIRVESLSTPRFSEAIELLDNLAMVDFLRDLPLSRSRHLLQVSMRMTIEAGEKIVTQGTHGDSFYIIVHGTVAIVRDGVQINRYRAGDYFGEMAILLDKPRSADAVAVTDVDLIAIDRNDFLSVLRGSEMLTRLERLVRVRDEGAWERIYAANRDQLTEPDRLEPGQVLKIPGKPRSHGNR